VPASACSRAFWCWPSDGQTVPHERPWGNYTVLSDEDDHKVKRIVVHPGKRLSYQTHARRAEHWYVVSGTATVTLDGLDREVGPGQAVDIARGMAHRCANQGTEDVVFIEVQRGLRPQLRPKSSSRRTMSSSPK